MRQFLRRWKFYFHIRVLFADINKDEDVSKEIRKYINLLQSLSDTMHEKAINGDDRKDVFFYQADDDHYIPRSILIDLEPRVINSIQTSEFKHFYNPENFFISKEGSGAGNCWATGYANAEHVEDEIMDMIEREAD